MSNRGGGGVKTSGTPGMVRKLQYPGGFSVRRQTAILGIAFSLSCAIWYGGSKTSVRKRSGHQKKCTKIFLSIYLHTPGLRSIAVRGRARKVDDTLVAVSLTLYALISLLYGSARCARVLVCGYGVYPIVRLYTLGTLLVLRAH
jgi:hypothetical protein